MSLDVSSSGRRQEFIEGVSSRLGLLRSGASAHSVEKKLILQHLDFEKLAL